MGTFALIAHRYVTSKLPASYEPGGRIAARLRLATGRRVLKSCGEGSNIERGAFFPAGMVSLGARSGIGIDAQIKGPVTIGDDVMMGPEVVIFTTGHEFEDTTRPMREQGSTAHQLVTIGDDVWIGQRAMILPGVTIGTGSIVAAGAVVTKDVPPRSVVGGNPARALRMRSNRGHEGVHQ